MLLEKLKKFHLILATGSPRRHFLMKGAGFEFDISIPDGIDESYPKSKLKKEIPEFLAEKKALAFSGKLYENDLVITADTIVLVEDSILGKPMNREEAILMLQLLSGRSHDVITGVCIFTKNKKKTFSSLSKVYFNKLTEDEIIFYVDNYKPYDKAGAYGAQEWIGYIGIEKIEGSYYNVMGLPIQMLYAELEQFIDSN